MEIKATQIEQVTALVLEARRRCVSYGRLVANMPGWEQKTVIWEYCEEKRKRGRRRKNGR